MADNQRDKILGIALDIGTTDIKGSLLGIQSKKELARANIANEQKAFGRDVITRLHFATKEKGLRELNKRIISAVNKLISQLIEDASADKSNIKKIVAVGNSAMYHLMFMINPGALARAPFLPAETAAKKKYASEMGIGAGKGAIFSFLPNISGFVGSDILASILIAELRRDEKYSLIMDMGTNGEIALGSKDKIFVASCASGPAFEGKHIRCGMPAVRGAIVGAKFKDGKFSFETAGGIPPKGISGSGLIDIISILLANGVVNRAGRMRDKEIVLYEKLHKKIYLAQKDVRQVQLAKGALAAGIEVLRRKANIAFRDLSIFYITGTFGGGIDKKNARDIGLIPKDMPLHQVSFLKDGALAGAIRVLLNPACEKEIDDIRANCEHVELHKFKGFNDIFAAAMSF